MLEYKPFNTEHLKFMKPQDEQRRDHAIFMNSDYADVVNNNFGLSVWHGNKCIAASGCVPLFSHRAVGWALLSSEAAEFMVPIVRKFRRVIESLEYSRIEISVRADFEGGHRFAKLIGMKLETPEPIKMHGANKEDEMLYAVVR